MKKIILLPMLLFLFTFGINQANAASLSKNTFTASETITISGSNFGNYGAYSYICFFNDNSCYSYGGGGILSWHDSSIRINIPNWIYETGMTGKIYIYSTNESNPVATLSYTLEPMIEGIYDEYETLRTIAMPNETLIIKGIGFGNSKNRVHFPSADAQIISWSDSQIKLIVPEVTKEGDFINIWYKHDKYARGDLYTFKNITSDANSAIQQYLNSTGITNYINTLDQKKEVVVAVIDDGIYINHPDLKEKIWLNSDEKIGDNIDNDSNGYIDDYYGYDFVNNTSEMSTAGGHGTNVAGIIGAKQNNYEGIGGIVNKVKLMSVIACNENGCPTSNIIDAIYYATENGADIINLSLSSGGTSGYTNDYDRAIQNAYNKGILVVVAAGNGDTEGGIGQDLGFIPQSPVCNDSGKNMILGVGASDLWNENIVSWSNNGDCVDVYAPGETIFSTSVPVYSTYGDFYEFTDGTSFSSPIVAGFAALIMSAYPNMPATDVSGYIRKNTNNGLLDANKVINKIEKYYVPPTSSTSASNETVDSQTPIANIFNDIDTDYKYSNAIMYLKKADVIGGYPDGSFQPNKTLNRAELLKILVGENLPDGDYSNCFNDVGTEWFALYVCYAKEQGWVEGYAGNLFKPAQTVNRAEAIKMAIEIYGSRLPGTANFQDTPAPYVDVSKDSWFGPCIIKSKALGLFTNMEAFQPADGMKRGNISDIIYRIIAIIELDADKYTNGLDSEMNSD